MFGNVSIVVMTRASCAQMNPDLFRPAQYLLQLLSLQVPFNLADTALSHEPERLVITSRPCEILNRVIGLDPDEECAINIQDIDPFARPGHDVAVPGSLQTIGHPTLGQVNGTFVKKIHGIVADVVRVNGPPSGGVEMGPLRSKGHGDSTGDSASVRDV